MEDTMSDRILIGEIERAGLPISAVAVNPASHLADAALTHMRWVKRETCFVLEWFNPLSREWQEVPCLISEEDKP